MDSRVVGNLLRGRSVYDAARIEAILHYVIGKLCENTVRVIESKLSKELALGS